MKKLLLLFIALLIAGCAHQPKPTLDGRLDYLKKECRLYADAIWHINTWYSEGKIDNNQRDYLKSLHDQSLVRLLDYYSHREGLAPDDIVALMKGAEALRNLRRRR